MLDIVTKLGYIFEGEKTWKNKKKKMKIKKYNQIKRLRCELRY